MEKWQDSGSAPGITDVSGKLEVPPENSAFSEDVCSKEVILTLMVFFLKAQRKNTKLIA